MPDEPDEPDQPDETGTVRVSPGGQNGVPTSAADRFAAGAAASLRPVAEQLDHVRDQVQAGQLHLNPESAHRLLASITKLQSRVHTLIARSGEHIDQPLQFGENFVGEAMSRRLRGAASGEQRAVLPVLEEFANQLNNLEGIVRRASGMITESDEHAAELLRKSEGGL